MRAVMLEVDPALLAERARLGLDRWDEMWDGELHMVPPPSRDHQGVGSQLLVALSPLARARGLTVTYETGYFAHEDDYRVPDLAVYRRDRSSRRGVEAAELVVEIRSPHDEAVRKIPWYLAHGCAEVVLLDPDTFAVEVHAGDGRRDPAMSEVLGCSFTTVEVDGRPALGVAWDGGAATVDAG